jgi:hypothetical protein
VPTYAFGLEQIDGGAAWLVAEDTVLSNQTPGANLRLRFTVANTGEALTNQTYGLEVSPKNAYPNCASVPATEYDPVTAAAGGCGTSPACMYSSSNITDHEATGELLSPPGVTAFVAGEVLEDPSISGNAMDLGINTHTEMEYNFQLSAVYATANAYCFRVSNSGTDLDSYSEIAEVTLLFPPTLSNLKFSNDNVINLTGSPMTTVTAIASTTDFNGWEDIDYATSTFYRSGVSGGTKCVPDNNNCYTASCSLSTPPSGNTRDITCSADVYFFADPTDIGTFSDQFWNAEMTVADNSGLKATDSFDDVVEMITLRSLTAVNDITYTSHYAGEDTGSDNELVVLTNTGNSPVNVVLEGSDLVGPTGSIAVANQRYSSSPFEYADAGCVICQFLTGESVQYDVDLPKPTNDTPVTDNLYWGINIPMDTKAETHVGEIRLGAVGI